MGNNSKYVQGWLDRRGQSETGKPTQTSEPTPPPRELTPEEKAKAPMTPAEQRPMRQTLPGVPPIVPGARTAGFRSEPDGVWHPAPSSKKFVEHFPGCPICKPEADTLGMKAE